jgi:predicted RNA-binding protein
MAQQTAVEWLHHLYKEGILIQKSFEMAKAMEKEQIIDFAMQMHKIDCSKTGTDILLNEAELYYNEIYNK